ncbi:MAG: AI-2E family transporter, partial [Candidatus Competibacteraceae bacterium]|nr:AI-2E family transporter [Candidatus Competibacteraceae bacterium]
MHHESQTRLWLIISAVFIGFLYLMAPVLTPFLFAALLAYLGDPLIDRLEAYKIPRTWAVALVFGVILFSLLLLLLFLIPMLTHQFKGLIQRLPVHIDWLQTHVLPWLKAHLGVDLESLSLHNVQSKLVALAQDIGDLTSSVLESFRASSTALFTWLADLILVPVVTFYLLRDWDGLVARVQELLPRRIEPVVSELAKESDEVIGAFLRGQVIVMAVLGVIYSLGLALIGLEFSLLIGMLAGLVSFVPYLGLITGIVVASIAALMQFHSILSLVPVCIVFGVGQLISDFLLTPKLVGDR